MMGFKEQPQSVKKVEVCYSKVVATTEKAYLLDIGGKEMWMPRSHCELDEETHTAFLTDWIATQKGLIV